MRPSLYLAALTTLSASLWGTTLASPRPDSGQDQQQGNQFSKLPVLPPTKGDSRDSELSLKMTSHKTWHCMLQLSNWQPEMVDQLESSLRAAFEGVSGFTTMVWVGSGQTYGRPVVQWWFEGQSAGNLNQDGIRSTMKDVASKVGSNIQWPQGT